MKRFLSWILLVFFLLLAIFFNHSNHSEPTSQEQSHYLPPVTLSVSCMQNGQQRSLSLEECVKAMLSQQISENIHLEAAKALVVAARSYLLSTVLSLQENGNPHPDTQLCDNPDHCVSLCFDDTPCSSFLDTALSETRGQFLTFGNLPIRAFYFEVSPGYTKSASEVWGFDLPYLISTPSPGDPYAVGYFSRVIYPKDAFMLILSATDKKPDFTTSPALGSITRTETGHVNHVILWDKSFSGQELQTLFHLKSCHFDLFFRDNQVVFEVYGTGHGVGMSKAGAQYFANSGWAYQKILAYYYPNTQLSIIPNL